MAERPEQLGQAPGLAIVRQPDGDVVLDFAGGPYIRLSAVKWRALAQAVPARPRRARETGTGWPGE